MSVISYRKAKRILADVFQKRCAEGTLLSESEDYYYGSADRWALAISYFSRYAQKGKVLDIGAWDGFFCCSLIAAGFSAAGIDWGQPMTEDFWKAKKIEWADCNIEADPIPFGNNTFSGIYMGQVLEHFTYSPKKPFLEFYRVLKPGGILIVDVPNIGEWHNFYRLIRGKNILYDYKMHYIDDEPKFYKGLPYFIRHNREFTRNELRVLAETHGFEVIRADYINSRRLTKKGWRKLEIPFTALRDVIPLFRKSIMLVARKPF